MAIAVAVGVGTACSYEEIDLCDPSLWVGPPPADLCGPLDADAGNARDAAAPIGACPGQCLRGPPFGWEPPGLLWFGPELQAPPCPDVAGALAYEGHGDLNAANSCGECQCDPPAGWCELPATLTANAATCAMTDPSTARTAFDPPLAWDGSCTTNDSVATGQLCDGGPCVESLTIAPLAVTETGCKPTQLPIPTDGPATWKTFARACRGFPLGTCKHSGDVCVALPAPGFIMCVFQKGDNDCSDHELVPFTEKHVFYKGLQDTRSCTACTCGPAIGSVCAAEVSIYSDDACASAAVVAVLADSNTPTCHDVMVGSGLGSKAASPPMYEPGACAPSGGEPMGSADPVNPATFCCIPSP